MGAAKLFSVSVDLSGMYMIRRFVRYSMPVECVRENGVCCLPGKCAGVVRENPIRGGDVKRVCSPGKGVNGGFVVGDSITQLSSCQEMNLIPCSSSILDRHLE